MVIATTVPRSSLVMITMPTPFITAADAHECWPMLQSPGFHFLQGPGQTAPSLASEHIFRQCFSKRRCRRQQHTFWSVFDDRSRSGSQRRGRQRDSVCCRHETVVRFGHRGSSGKARTMQAQGKAGGSRRMP